jgi:hypothetical protein
LKDGFCNTPLPEFGMETSWPVLRLGAIWM